MIIRNILAPTLLSAATAFAVAATEPIVFPRDAGVIDVTEPPYEADTIHDATAAIQQALDDYPNGNRIIYLPAGTYTVSSTLRYGGTTSGNREKRTTLHGAGKDNTILKLIDNAPGYDSPDSRKAVVWCGTAPAQRFGNSIRHLTIHTGNGNPGACGIQYNTSNQGMVEQVRIVSGDGQGVIGLDISYTNEIGPALVRHCTIEGFSYGIKTTNNVNSMTFEDLSLQGQSTAGIRNSSQVLTFRNITSVNSVPVLDNGSGSGMVTIVDGHFSGGDASTCAVRNAAHLFVRNLHVQGYGCSIDNIAGTERKIADTVIVEFHSHPAAQLFSSPTHSLNLPAPDSPEPAWEAPEQWVNIMAHGAVGDGSTDDTKAIQAALDAGKSTVYFPAPYAFRIDGMVTVPGTARRIIGTRGKLKGNGTLLFAANSGDTTVFERFDWGYSAGPSIDISGSGTVAIRSCALPGITAGGSGNLFVDDVTNHTMRDKDLPLIGLHITNPAQKVWCRQFNPETHRAPKIVNEGGHLWILGLKTENANTIIEATNGAITEVLGAHIYAQGDMKTTPMLINDESALSVAGLRQYDWHTPNRCYTELVAETRDGVTRTLTRDEQGDFLTLYTGYTANQSTATAPHRLPSQYATPRNGTARIYDLRGRLQTNSTMSQVSGVWIHRTIDATRIRLKCW